MTRATGRAPEGRWQWRRGWPSLLSVMMKRGRRLWPCVARVQRPGESWPVPLGDLGPAADGGSDSSSVLGLGEGNDRREGGRVEEDGMLQECDDPHEQIARGERGRDSEKEESSFTG